MNAARRPRPEEALSLADLAELAREDVRRGDRDALEAVADLVNAGAEPRFVVGDPVFEERPVTKGLHFPSLSLKGIEGIKVDLEGDWTVPTTGKLSFSLEESGEGTHVGSVTYSGTRRACIDHTWRALPAVDPFNLAATGSVFDEDPLADLFKRDSRGELVARLQVEACGVRAEVNLEGAVERLWTLGGSWIDAAALQAQRIYAGPPGPQLSPLTAYLVSAQRAVALSDQAHQVLWSMVNDSLGRTLTRATEFIQENITASMHLEQAFQRFAEGDVVRGVYSSARAASQLANLRNAWRALMCAQRATFMKNNSRPRAGLAAAAATLAAFNAAKPHTCRPKPATAQEQRPESEARDHADRLFEAVTRSPEEVAHALEHAPFELLLYLDREIAAALIGHPLMLP